MIAMVLGLIVIAAVFKVYAGNSRSTQFTEGIQSMQENGRYGVTVLQRGLRLAGYSSTGYIDAFDMAQGGINTIAVRTMQAYDCNGADTGPTNGLAVNVYRHDVANNQLTCQGNQANSASMALVEGVESFRVLYGLDSDGDELTSEPQQYVPFDAAIDPADIVSLRFSLLINSSQPIHSRNISGTYVLLDEELTVSDRMAREVYSSTVKLRNRQ